MMLAGTLAQSAPQVTPTGFLVKFDVNANASVAKVYDALVGQVGSWWNPEHTYSHDAKNTRMTRGQAVVSARSCRTAAELNICVSFTSRRRKLCGSREASARFKAPVLPEA